MPYKHREDRLRHSRHYGRQHYAANRQWYIDREAARKQRLKREERAMKKCRACGGQMTQEEVGGRKYLECERASCGRRILLDPKTTDYAGRAHEALNSHPLEDTMPTIDQPPQPPQLGGKMPPLSEAARRRIGAGVRAAHARKLAQEENPPHDPHADTMGRALMHELAPGVAKALAKMPALSNVTGSQTPPRRKPGRPPKQAAPEVEIQIRPLVELPPTIESEPERPERALFRNLEDTLQRLLVEEGDLKARLAKNYEQQGALRKARGILLEVQA